MPDTTAEPRRCQAAVTFVKAVFSDSGEPSSSRILSFIFGLVTCCVIITIVHHMTKLTDPTTLGMWLANLPMIVASLSGMTGIMYGINRASGSISDVIFAMRGKRE